MAKIRLLATSALGLAMAGLSACSPTPVATPSFAADVQPIFLAHCTRCHGGGPDGGLQGEPANYPLGKPPKNYDTTVPAYCHLDAYDNVGDCQFPDGSALPSTLATCHLGAAWCAMNLGPTLLGYVRIGKMPLPPAPGLNSWELDVVNRWVMNPIP